MSIILRITLIVVSVLCLVYVLRKIRYSKLQIEYALFWIVFSGVLVVIAIFPEIVYWVTSIMHMMSPANVVFLAVISIMILKIFMMTIEISQLENKINKLVQELALSEKAQQDKIEEIEEKDEKQ